MPDDPTDADFEAILRAAPAERWQDLWDAMAALEADPEPMTWGGGEVVGTRVVDGVEKPVTQMPYAVYSEAVENVRTAIGWLGLIVPFAWPQWEGCDRYQRGAGMDQAPVADAVRLITAIIRSERFGEGSIGGAIKNGTLSAAVRRLRTWVDAQP